MKQQYGLRRGSFEPALSDEEVITMEICGEYFKLGCDKDMFAYFSSHYRHFFPKLRDRSLFVRQAANLWHVTSLIQKHLTAVSDEMNDSVQVIDTIPLPVCVITKAGRDRCFPGEADFGYCAAKDMHYYGFKLGLRIWKNLKEQQRRTKASIPPAEASRNSCRHATTKEYEINAA